MHAQDRAAVLHVGPWRIDVVRRAGTARLLGNATLARAAARALEAAGAPAPSGVTIVLTDDAELRDLNRAHLGRDAPTDVLSFPLLPPDSFPGRRGGSARMPPRASSAREPGTRRGGRTHLGDVAISVERAIDQAEAGRGGQTGDVRWSAADELRLLVTHGVLHLCGWDHAVPADEAAMRELEQRLLTSGERLTR